MSEVTSHSLAFHYARFVDYFCELYRKNMIDLSLNFCPLMNNWQEVPKIIAVANDRNIPVTLLTVIIPPYLSLKNVSACVH